MKKPIYYRGRGHDKLYSYVQTNGTLSGNIIRNTGDRVAGVEIDIQNSELILEVDGQTFSSITNALNELYPSLAVNDADGSEGSGNLANNIIGNYAILKHVVFGNVTLEDIVGVTPASPNRKGTVKVKAKKILEVAKDPTVTASGNLYRFFARDIIVPIAKQHGGAEGFQDYLKGKTVGDFATENGLAI